MSKVNLKQLLIRKRDEKGLASIVIVAVLVVLLSLISIGFARLMDRAVNGALNNQLSSSASYAAQSGLNDAIAYVEANPGAKSTTCGGLLSGTSTVSKPINPDFTGTNGNSNYKYTCILVNPNPPDLLYSQLPPSESQVAEINPAAGGPPASLLLSWQATGTDSTKNKLDCQTPNLYNEIDWANNGCPPLMRVTLYPVDSSNNVNQSNSKTFYLYPNDTGGNSVAYTTADGTIVPINCSTTPTGSGYTTFTDQCNAVVSGLTSVAGISYLYVRMTPIYDNATVDIRANNNAGTNLTFQNDQTILDVTAQAGTASKRLQARVSVGSSNDITPSEDAMPEDSLRSADTICKRLEVTPNTVLDQGTACNGQLNITQLPLVMDFCVDSSAGDPCSGNIPTSATVNYDSPATLRWTVENSTACSSTNFTGPTGDNTGSTPTSDLTATTEFTLSCTGVDGSQNTSTVTVSVNPPSGGGTGCTTNCNPGGGTGCTTNCNPGGGTGCTTNCNPGGGSSGGGGGANDILGFEFDPSQPTQDDFILTTQNNPGYCVISGDTDLSQGVAIWAPANGQYEYDFGPGTDTTATVNCYDQSFNPAGSAGANRNGSGGNAGDCTPNPETDPFGVTLECLNDTDEECDNYGELILYTDQWGGLDVVIVGTCTPGGSIPGSGDGGGGGGGGGGGTSGGGGGGGCDGAGGVTDPLDGDCIPDGQYDSQGDGCYNASDGSGQAEDCY